MYDSASKSGFVNADGLKFKGLESDGSVNRSVIVRGGGGRGYRSGILKVAGKQGEWMREF